MTDILYKYRNLNDYKRFIDILINKRLYASNYKDLNDPMEGQYYYSEGILNHNVREKLYNEKNALKILALSKDNNNALMWAHYADGERGIAIGVKIDNHLYEVADVVYDGPHSVDRNNYRNLTAKEILKHKLNVWDYEKEVRVFVENNKHVFVKIHQIILGSKINTKDKEMIKRLTDFIDPNIQIIERNR